MVNSVDIIFTGTNGTFIAELYERYLENPNSVDPSWASVFLDLDDDPKSIQDDIRGASWSRSNTTIIGSDQLGDSEKNSDQSTTNITSGQINEIAKRSIRARILIRSYRVRGHLHAAFDPLGLVGAGYHKELDYKSYDFTEEDLDTEIYLDTITAMGGKEQATLRQVLETMRQSYCDSIGVEYMHIQEMEERAWIQKNIEGVDYKSDYSSDLRKAIYKDLVEAEGFENYLQNEYIPMGVATSRYT
jgi:2-oxoglutarate dehydrogenase E1 component